MNTTNCPDCGQARTEKGCGGCAMVGRLLREHKGEHGATRRALCCFSLLIGFQKARAEKAEEAKLSWMSKAAIAYKEKENLEARVRELEEAIERHKTFTAGRLLAPDLYMNHDKALWAVLEGGEERG